MKFENTQVFFGGALRGMRNPLESWDKSDSYRAFYSQWIGPKDLELAQKLVKAGTDHSKFMRQIFVSTDIIAPVYAINEWVTYKVGTTMNSTSMQHTLAKRPITREMFDFPEEAAPSVDSFIKELEKLRIKYNETKDYNLFVMLRALMPMGFKYRVTWSGNYQVLRNMYLARKNHKLPQWRIDFVNWVKTLSYGEELIMI